MDPSYKQIYLPTAKRFLAALGERYDKPGSPVIMWRHWDMAYGASGTLFGPPIHGPVKTLRSQLPSAVQRHYRYPEICYRKRMAQMLRDSILAIKR